MQFAQQAHRDGVPWESAGNVEFTQRRRTPDNSALSGRPYTSDSQLRL